MHHDRGAIKVNMNLLFKDYLSTIVLSIRIKGGEPLNFLSEPMIKNGKGLQKLNSNLNISSLSSNFE